MNLIKPKKLKVGSKIAAVTLSWGGPGTLPHRYEIGKKQFEDEFKVKVVETKNALKDPKWIYKNPQARADDLMHAFSDPSIDGIISTIGGEDSIRILPFLDLEVIKSNPKVFMGYSDTNVTHFACLKAGLSSFYGPTFMAGFAENTGLFPYMIDSVRKTLFSNDIIGIIVPNELGWTDEFLDWSKPENQNQKRKLFESSEWRFIQGSGVHQGHLIGGCSDALEFLKGTAFWPQKEDWKGAILFLENSEEAPSPAIFKRWLRNYAAQGILQSINGILFGRPMNVPKEKHVEYDDALLSVVRDELDLKNLPIVTNLDFGHTDPMFVIPYGMCAEINVESKSLSFIESAVS